GQREATHGVARADRAVGIDPDDETAWVHSRILPRGAVARAPPVTRSDAPEDGLDLAPLEQLIHAAVQHAVPQHGKRGFVRVDRALNVVVGMLEAEELRS